MGCAASPPLPLGTWALDLCGGWGSDAQQDFWLCPWLPFLLCSGRWGAAGPLPISSLDSILPTPSQGLPLQKPNSPGNHQVNLPASQAIHSTRLTTSRKHPSPSPEPHIPGLPSPASFWLFFFFSAALVAAAPGTLAGPIATRTAHYGDLWPGPHPPSRWLRGWAWERRAETGPAAHLCPPPPPPPPVWLLAPVTPFHSPLSCLSLVPAN